MLTARFYMKREKHSLHSSLYYSWLQIPQLKQLKQKGLRGLLCNLYRGSHLSGIQKGHMIKGVFTRNRHKHITCLITLCLLSDVIGIVVSPSYRHDLLWIGGKKNRGRWCVCVGRGGGKALYLSENYHKGRQRKTYIVSNICSKMQSLD